MHINVLSRTAARAAVVLAWSTIAPAAAHAQNVLEFEPLASSAACTAGGDPAAPFVLPAGLQQTIFASEPAFPDLPDMNTLNETGFRAGELLYRTHETTDNGAVTVTDLHSLQTFLLAQRSDWERFDGIVWTPWGTILAAEEAVLAGIRDPKFPRAEAGLVYEIFPGSGRALARPAIGSRSHEGLRFDRQGNLYGISESSPPTGGYIYKFVPDEAGKLASGQLYVLKITHPTGDRIGRARWIPLDRSAVKVNSDVAATAAGATGYGRPEDVETVTSTGTTAGGRDILYVAITSENRVLAIDLQGTSDPHTTSVGAARAGSQTAFVSDYVRAGLNAPVDFTAPDNLALDKAGNLFIAEDPGGTAPTKVLGDDIWVARPSPDDFGLASETVRFASLTDCDAEPSGIYFPLRGSKLFVNVMHRGGDGRDLAVEITE
ncbi:MAG: DUF839 domain-containing protein [Gemmatimonadetes bacterium]|nr:DUF839 domain-containing protein [Gemmatimonadota bacterium]